MDTIVKKTNSSVLSEDKLWNEFIKNRDNSALRISLVELYLPIVVDVVSKLSFNIRSKVENEELLSSGVVGLHKAISSFLPGKGVEFSRYAYKRIKGAIIDDLRDQDPLTRTQRDHYKEICATINRLTKEFSRPPTDKEISEATNLSEKDISRYMGMGSETVKLSEEFQNGLRYVDVLVDSTAPTPFDSTDRVMKIENLRESFRSLDEREQKILFLRHYEEMSVKEVARVLEISEGRVSQICNKIVIKLKALMGA